MNEFIKQRSFELSYALFQLARLIKQKDLRGRVEANAVYLLESSEGVEAASLTRAIAVLKKLIILGEGIGEISYDHSKVINKQFANLNAAIAEYSAIKDSTEQNNSAIDMDKIFNKGSLLHNSFQSARADVLSEGVSKKTPKRLRDISIPRTPSLYSANSDVSSRQEAIIQKLRQSGNDSGCQLKDIIAAFPSVSERTLRYDLQKVCEQGVVERVGNGGPTSYYRLRQRISSSVPLGEVSGVTN